MSQPLCFQRCIKLFTEVIASINADEIILGFSVSDRELDPLPSPSPKTHTQNYGGVGPGLIVKILKYTAIALGWLQPLKG